MSAIGHVEPGVGATSAPPLIRHTGHAPLGALVPAIASLWLAAAISGALAGRLAIVPGLGSSGAYWAGVVGTALVALPLYWIMRRKTVVIDRGALLVTKRTLLGGHAWRQPLSNHREIRGQRRPQVATDEIRWSRGVAAVMPSTTRRAFLGTCAAVWLAVARSFPGPARVGNGHGFVIVNGWILRQSDLGAASQ